MSVGGAVSVNTVDETVSAYVDGANLNAGRNIDLDADTKVVIGSLTVGAPMSMVAAGASVAVNTTTNETKAYIANSLDTDAGGDIIIEASDLTVIGSLTGNVAGGAAAAGAAVAGDQNRFFFVHGASFPLHASGVPLL